METVLSSWKLLFRSFPTFDEKTKLNLCQSELFLLYMSEFNDLMYIIESTDSQFDSRRQWTDVCTALVHWQNSTFQFTEGRARGRAQPVKGVVNTQRDRQLLITHICIGITKLVLEAEVREITRQNKQTPGTWRWPLPHRCPCPLSLGGRNPALLLSVCRDRLSVLLMNFFFGGGVRREL